MQATLFKIPMAVEGAGRGRKSRVSVGGKCGVTEKCQGDQEQDSHLFWSGGGGWWAPNLAKRGVRLGFWTGKGGEGKGSLFLHPAYLGAYWITPSVTLN